jgi:hypothetical protein
VASILQPFPFQAESSGARITETQNGVRRIELAIHPNVLCLSHTCADKWADSITKHTRTVRVPFSAAGVGDQTLGHNVDLSRLKKQNQFITDCAILCCNRSEARCP